MEVNRFALEMLFRTMRERFSEHPFKSSLYPRKRANYSFNLTWKGLSEPIEYDFKEVDDIFTNSIHEIVDGVQDDRIGVMLSGGIDSALLLYLIRREYPEADVVAYHTDWGSSYVEGIEVEGARNASAFCNSPLHILDGGLNAQIPYVQSAIKDTLTMNYSVTLFYLAFDQIQKDGIDVVLLGDGLDSFFGGGRFHKIYYMRPRFGIIPLIQRLIGFRPYSMATKILGREFAWFVCMISNQPSEIVNESQFTFDTLYNRVKSSTLWDLVQNWNVDNGITDAAVTARAAWSHDLDILFPFMTQDILDLSSIYTPEFNKNKNIIRKYMRDLGFPEGIVQTGISWDKKGWGATVAPYFDEQYMNEIRPNLQGAEYWFTKKGLELISNIHRTHSPNAFIMLLFLKILELNEWA